MNSSTAAEQTTRTVLANRDIAHSPDYDSLRRTARMAGLLYLLGGLTAVFSFAYVPTKVLVEGDGAATASNILAHEALFRMGIVSTLAGQIISAFFILVLYRLFKPVNERQARLMLALVLVQIPIAFVLEVFDLVALLTLKGEAWNTLAPEQRQNMAMLLLDINQYGTKALEVLWGMWLFPFGRLVYQSGFIPRIFGVFLLLNGIAYLIDSLTFLLFPGSEDIVSKFMFPLFFGEVAIMLWLLIKGARTPAVQPAAG